MQQRGHVAKSSSSVFLSHLSASLTQLRRAFDERSEAAASAAPCKLPSDEALDTVEGGRRLIDCLSRDIGIGQRSLAKWRDHQFNARTIANPGSSSRQRWDKMWNSASSVVPGTFVASDDARLAESFVKDLSGVLSPFVQLASRTTSSPRAADTASSELIATRDIAAGMFLFSLPTEAVLFSDAPALADGDIVAEHFLHVDDLAGQLLASAAGATADDSTTRPSHRVYAQYLRKTVTPPNNLPFLDKCDLRTSDAVPLWEQFHIAMRQQPLSEYLAANLSADEYLWYVAVVMSRKCGHSMIVPLLDKLNHSAEPNAYFTMSTERSFCGVDLLDNIVAGVSEELLVVPHVHVFAINPIPKGTPVTISYSDANPSTDEGADLWKLNWGFVPPAQSAYKEEELRVIANIVAARRVEQLSSLFPPEAGGSSP